MKLITYDELKAKKGIPLSRMQLWRLEKDGLFPARIRFTHQRMGWLEAEIDEWLKAKADSRPGAHCAA